MKRGGRIPEALGVGLFVLLLLFLLWDGRGYPVPSFQQRVDPFAETTRLDLLLNDFAFRLREAKEERLARRAERREIKARWDGLREFRFGGRFLSCENADEGRWFIHFREDGTIGFSTPSGEKATRKFRYDGGHFELYDLSAVFEDGATYERVDGRTIRFSGASGVCEFRIKPKFSGSVEFCCNTLSFQEVGAEEELSFQLKVRRNNEESFGHYLERNRSKSGSGG